ncbi:MAG: riboflavin biosynthesis protein RibF [Clostridiales bacterium]|nr:riboflavin biosynthesis protein RibF [Clostridiales bacterium]
MKTLTLTTKYNEPICFALGFFDCVHRGHRALFEEAREMAGRVGAKVGAVTFSDNPSRTFGKESQLIYTFEERKILLAQEVDAVLALPFSKELQNTPPPAFLQMLMRAFDVRGFVCGYDYKFGANAEGDSIFLQEFCSKNNIMCGIVQPITLENVRVSSTKVKELLHLGDIENVVRFLGHAYTVEGEVCHGHGRGHVFNFPTANLQVDADKLLPKTGVYATYAYTDTKKYKAVTNVGNCPTFGNRETTVETMLIDFEGDLYGKTLCLEFVRRLRDIRTFSSPQALYKQIINDTKWENEE